LNAVVRETVEQTLNSLLDAEADSLCGARRYERSDKRVDTRAGHYERSLHTTAGPVTLKVPKLRTLPFESAIIGQMGLPGSWPVSSIVPEGLLIPKPCMEPGLLPRPLL
jgi:transposase-like protein